MQKTVFIFLVTLFGCHQAEEKKTFPETILRTNSKAQILHGIVVHEGGGLQISRAFLSHEDGSFINSRNTVRIGEVVCLNLVVQGGWMSEHDSVSIGATQNIIAESGERILSAADLFGVKTKMEQAKAAHLLLKTTLTRPGSGTRRFLVRYRVWDKMGPGEASGSYWLNLAGDEPK